MKILKESTLCQKRYLTINIIPYISYVTKNGDLYASGKGIGDGSNIPRKTPILVFQNVIKSAIFKIGYDMRSFLLTSNGELYVLDTKIFRYELLASNVYLFMEQDVDGFIYFTNNGSVYNFDGKLLFEDLALPKLK